MLEKDYQLSAYKALAASGGMKTPEAVTTSTSCATAAKTLADQLAGLVLDTITYPATITEYITAITGHADTLSAVNQLASEHASLLTANADLSVLLQLNIGWDVYCRANALEASELPISLAIGDKATPGALLDAVNALDAAAVVAAMTEINQVLNTGAGGGTEGGAVPPAPSLTQDQIDALKAACAEFDAAMDGLPSPRNALKAQHDKASESASTGMQAYNDAVGTALAEASANNSSTASAVAALVPESVMEELKKGTA
ncbi:TPA: hypothetical protein O3G95_004766 [Salmonella enterica subsp. enterica serovar Saintpaul str. CFSAN004147]|nr:hypothetical protein [Salmonella enterica subsp. enterica serovar Saintpaul str. CFSAN004147]HCZ5289097.1 hypothetical protein [Salmonella enterica subsp. enterica serovar Saintpaul str. CFSAN004154]